jgi:hypothetical protein
VANPGKTDLHQPSRRYSRPSLSIAPTQAREAVRPIQGN